MEDPKIEIQNIVEIYYGKRITHIYDNNLTDKVRFRCVFKIKEKLEY